LWQHTWGVFFLKEVVLNYSKPPITYEEQISLLESRGLIIEDYDRARRYLNEISYYRLSAYALPYQRSKDKFNEGISFEHLLELYLFDRELRLLVFDAIERIEVAIRSQLIYQLSHKYGSHWQDDSSIFKPPFKHSLGFILDVFTDTQKIISEHCKAKHQEVFIKHYTSKYTSPRNPPSWMSIELLTVGQLSRLFTALRHNQDKQAIADFFGLHHTVFTSWLHTLTYVRNICAHHSRLWNRELSIKPELLLKPRRPWLNADFDNNNARCFYLLCTVKYLLCYANPSNHMKEKLAALFDKYPSVPIRFLGIPSDDRGRIINWQAEPIWNS
jgi:abortive infection bacteriophage resistance protein